MAPRTSTKVSSPPETSSTNAPKRTPATKTSSSKAASGSDTPVPQPSSLKKTRRPKAELASKVMDVPETPPVPEFDVKSILPQTKSTKTIEQLRASRYKNASMDGPFLCIDGEMRSFEPTPVASEAPIASGSGSRSSEEVKKPQFSAYGIEAYPTICKYNEICYDFVRPGRWCYNNRMCVRIHPLNKEMYLDTVIEQAAKRSRTIRGDGVSPPVSSAADVPAPISIPASTCSKAPIETPPPPTTSIVSSSLVHALPPKPTFNAPASSSSNLNTRVEQRGSQIVPSAAKKPQYSSSDTSSEHEPAPRRRVLRVQRARYPDTDPRAWIAQAPEVGWSDSDYTDEEGTPFVIRIPRPSAITIPQYPTRPNPTSINESRPIRSVELCRNFLQNKCHLGDACRYAHGSQPERNMPLAIKAKVEPSRQSQTEVLPVDSKATTTHSFTMTLHNHMRVTFGVGYVVESVTTGFESQWVFIGGLPKEISDAKVEWLMLPFGKVLEVKRLDVPTYQGFNVHFAEAEKAYQAFSKLNGTKQYGNVIEVRVSMESNGLNIRDNVVCIGLKYRTRSVVVGYTSHQLAEAAIENTRSILFKGAFIVRAKMHSGIPAVGFHSVWYDDLPCDPTREEMAVFGPCTDIVTISKTMPYTVHHQETIDGLERHVKGKYKNTLTSLEFKQSPYAGGNLTAWVRFKTAKDARDAASHLNGMKPDYTNRTFISAQHQNTISISMSSLKFRYAEVAFKEFTRKIATYAWNTGNARSYNVHKYEKLNNTIVELVGTDMAILGRMKADLDKVMNGEVLMQNGKIVWDGFFALPQGFAFIENLEREVQGARVGKNLSRRMIRLFGPSRMREIARDRILMKVAQLNAQRWHLIPLNRRIVSPLLRGKYDLLRERLGAENLFFDITRMVIKVRGDEGVIFAATAFIDALRAEVEGAADATAPENACPVCLSEPSSPVSLPCGHSSCKACLQSYLLAATELKAFPIKCLGDEGRCTQLVPLATGKTHLHVGDGQALLVAAFAAHVETHPEAFRYCPTPDCPQIYRPASSGCFIQCPACLVKICAGCSKDAHEGLTCKEVNEGDLLFREWLEKNDVKQCPKCSIAIEKIEGCNHMQCTNCRAHVCWECLGTFKDASETYGHMRDVHGGWGLGPME